MVDLDPSGISIAQTINMNRLGYSDYLGEKKRQDMQTAGGLLAKGDYKGGASALYGSGNLDEGLQVQKLVAQLDDKALAEKTRQQAAIGNFAALIDPSAPDAQERWARGHAALKATGITLPTGSENLAYRDVALSQAKMAQDALDMELRRRQEARAAETSALDMDIKRRALATKEAPQYHTIKDGEGLYETQPGKEARIVVAPTGKGRQLGVNDITKLSDEGAKYENASRYIQTFKDDFAGHTFAGEATMTYGRNAPDFAVGERTRNAAQWWQDYNRYRNQVRNEMFGSALTVNEQAAFDAADITPNMAPSQVRANLNRQKEAIASAIRKKGQALTRSGYSPDAVGAAYGVDLGEMGVTVPKGARADAPKAPGGGKPVTAADFAWIKRAQEQGWTRDQIIDALKAEGYDPGSLK
jgi:hypothetical protein